MPDDDTKIIHAVLRIGNNSRITLADEFPGMCDSNHSDGKIGSPKTVGGNSVFLSMYFEMLRRYLIKLKVKELP